VGNPSNLKSTYINAAGQIYQSVYELLVYDADAVNTKDADAVNTKVVDAVNTKVVDAVNTKVVDAKEYAKLILTNEDEYEGDNVNNIMALIVAADLLALMGEPDIEYNDPDVKEAKEAVDAAYAAATSAAEKDVVKYAAKAFEHAAKGGAAYAAGYAASAYAAATKATNTTTWSPTNTFEFNYIYLDVYKKNQNPDKLKSTFKIVAELIYKNADILITLYPLIKR
jgi:hypothetical protein